MIKVLLTRRAIGRCRMSNFNCLPILASAATLCIAAAIALPVRADVVTDFLVNGDSGISGFPGPYASVTIDLNTSTTANVTFQALGNYTMGSANLNINANDLSVSEPIFPTNSYPNFTPILCCSAIGSGGIGDPVDDLGTFNLILHNVGDLTTFMNSSTTINFTVSNLSATWSSAADVLLDNGQGLDEATLIFVCNADPCALADGATNTGYAVGPGPVPPAPAPAPLVGRGLRVLLTIGTVFSGAKLLERSKKRRSAARMISDNILPSGVVRAVSSSSR
jgi:hypothetical protein